MEASKKDLRILVVDDEPFILNLNVKILNRLGYEQVETALDGRLALERLKSPNDAIDVILCDLNMPVMDGVELIRHIKKCGFSGALILCSGEDQRMLDTALNFTVVNKLYVLGAINKPIDPQRLQMLLERYSARSTADGGGELYTLTEEDLRKALLRDEEPEELELHFQPQIEIRTGAITSVEALARWRHGGEVLAPSFFIPLAEECGLIHPLTMHVYRKALKSLRGWEEKGLDLSVAINFSINSFSNPDLPQLLLSLVREYGVFASRITIEVTESQVMQNASNCLEALMRLRLNQFKLSIDDFGTGNSSLLQLMDIPFNELKIDRAFVQGASQQASKKAILEASVTLARSLGMNVVAEGVEDREDWDIVESLQIDHVQGYYCSKPLPEDELLQLLASWQGPHQV